MKIWKKSLVQNNNNENFKNILLCQRHSETFGLDYTLTAILQAQPYASVSCNTVQSWWPDLGANLCRLKDLVFPPYMMPMKITMPRWGTCYHLRQPSFILLCVFMPSLFRSNYIKITWVKYRLLFQIGPLCGERRLICSGWHNHKGISQNLGPDSLTLQQGLETAACRPY